MSAVVDMDAMKPLKGRAWRLLNDLPYYAEHCLKIRPKAGGLVPFVLNKVQTIVHERLEAQKAAAGRVRALVLKARQPGISTYVEGRYWHQVTQREGISAYILTHAQQATDTIFGMAQRFHDNMPEPLQLATVAANAKELKFAGLDSGIQVSTAGAKGAGRGGTVNLFHGSEVAHWSNAADHMAGVLQSVPDAPGTEIILESTANGVGGLFFDMCQAALRGEGEYILIFVPWFEHDEYRADPPEGWTSPEAFQVYAEAHKLTADRVYWAWRKNAELAKACGGPVDEICWLFRQEYPATAAEAFQLSDHESYISGEAVLAARRFEGEPQSDMPLILGVDIARGGKDKTRIVDRRGRRAGHVVNEIIDSDDLMDLVGRVGLLIERHKPDMVFIDGTGMGAGVYDRLSELGHPCVRMVNFGAKASEVERFANKRAEMWARMGEWLTDGGGADIPDADEWQIALCAPGYSFDSLSRLLLEPKEKIRARIGSSPDVGDALALTFAHPVVHVDLRKIDPLRRGSRGRDRGPYAWMGA